MESWSLTLLGGFELRLADGEVVDLPGQKDRALLALLAMGGGDAHSRERLAGLLWSEHGDRQARDSLRQALVRLRRCLGGVEGRALRTDRQSMVLDRIAVDVDVLTFERLVQDSTLASLERATEIYRGDLLEGIAIRDPAFEDWLLIERQRLGQLFERALAGLMAQALAAGDREQAAEAARRLLQTDPLSEAAYRTLMQVHADEAQTAQALKLYEALRERLYRELGVAPESATVALYDRIRQRQRPPSPKPPPDAAAAPEDREDPPPATKSAIAVLPFTNMSGDPDQEYFADGLTEDIITDLSRVSALSVVARHTVFTLKGKPLHVQQVARELKVDYLLQGSVRKADGRVRVTAQLIDGVSGDHRWAHRYDRHLDDVFALQDEISKSIVDVLRVTLLPAELETITRHQTADARAYEYYLMGRFFYLRGQGKRHLAIARDMYAKAAEIDPDYARAYAGMAICDSYAAVSHPDGSFESALANSERALALDADLAEAYAAKGFALYAAVRFDEAAVEFERATRLDAGLFEAHFFHARNCHNQGLRAEAAALFARAAELRPSDFRSPGLLAWECKALGRREQCATALRRCLARLEAEVKAHPDNADALVFGSSILVESGDSARAEDWAARAIMLGSDDHFVQYNAALTNAMLGRMDAALDHLEQAFSTSPAFRRRLAAWMKYDGEMNTLGDQPRFQALLASLASGAPPAAQGKAPAATKPSIAAPATS